MNIIEKLEDRRISLGMSNRQFATHLGVSDAQWSDTRNGKERFGQKLARGVALRFKDLAQEAAMAVVSEEIEAEENNRSVA